MNNFSAPSFHHLQEGADSLSIMMKKECATYACSDYLNDRSSSRSRSSGLNHEQKITPDDRSKLVDWCYEIVDRCRLDRESVAVAMDIADRFMCTIVAQGSQGQGALQVQDSILYDRGQYQLLILTAIYISIKLNGQEILSSADFSAITHDSYSTEEIESMELKILHGLKWIICCPTALQMGYQILELMATASSQVREAKNAGPLDSGRIAWNFLREELAFQTETAVRGYRFVTQRYSTIAVASILNAIEQVNDVEYEIFLQALIYVTKMGEFQFDSLCVLLNVRDQLKLRCLMVENEEFDETDLTSETPIMNPSDGIVLEGEDVRIEECDEMDLASEITTMSPLNVNGLAPDDEEVPT
mmetsp:Transcript_36244/g.76166  ORF Transcript_36244/g.76166 Transcript_36244/m.76166 type:complete len:359 (+) Transcript_36244:63-1139(+)